MTARSKFSISLEQLRKSACAKLNPHLFEEPKKKKKGKSKIGGKIVSAIYSTGSTEKDHMIMVLFDFCVRNGFRLYQEFRFTEDRLWRFDWCIPELGLAIEYEGIFSNKSGHTTAKGYSKDTEKYNRAEQEGWYLLRFTALTYRSLHGQLTSFFQQSQQS